MVGAGGGVPPEPITVPGAKATPRKASLAGAVAISDRDAAERAADAADVGDPVERRPSLPSVLVSALLVA